MPLTPAERFAGLTPQEQAEILARPVPSQAIAPDPVLEGPIDDGDAFAELVDFYDETLLLRHAGHEYVLHAVDVETGLMCQRLVNLGLGALTDYNLAGRAIAAQEGTEDTLDDSTEEALYRRLLGGDKDHPGYSPRWDVWAELKENHAPWTLMRHMGVTALMWAGRDRSVALGYWLDGSRPKAPAPAPPKPKTPADRRPKRQAGTATTTPQQDSTSSTTRRPAKGTRGKKS